jgi:hypothetical protein
VTETAQSFLAGIIIIAILFVLVRPNSKGPLLVNTAGIGLYNLIAASTGGTQKAYPKDTG